MRGAVLAAVVATLATVPATAYGEAPRGDSVMGSGGFLNSCPGGCAAFTIDAHSDGAGGGPTGTYTSGGGTPSNNHSFDGRVTCLKVSGNLAVVGVYGTLRVFGDAYGPDPPPPRQGAFWIYLRDNGASSGQVYPDEVAGHYLRYPPPTPTPSPTAAPRLNRPSSSRVFRAAT
jgi:hypothetical protein